jgi:hypothetical protein
VRCLNWGIRDTMKESSLWGINTDRRGDRELMRGRFVVDARTGELVPSVCRLTARCPARIASGRGQDIRRGFKDLERVRDPQSGKSKELHLLRRAPRGWLAEPNPAL